ncbi:MAG TPA: pitrilysin family protein [Anaeromyxobacteraceae bacterium]|nr:pitrilysin family protein [Anaeromyxobacteraceae bacterium]
MRPTKHLAALAALGALVAPARAAPPAADPAPDLAFEKYRLGNGLEVILHQDRRLPLAAVDVWYHVGAWHEPAGRSGFAHLFEHMMFQGSRDVGKEQHSRILERAGGTIINGSTDFDRTNYFETVPRNYLETALWLESDRMGLLLDAMTQEKLDNQREVVKNERRQSRETAPYGFAEEALWHALFPAGHPYHGAVIGSMADLSAATLEDVKGFFAEWYAPSNATLAIAGDIELDQVKRSVERYFGSLPARPRPSAARHAPVRLEREVVLRHEETVATLPRLSVAWHTPAFFAAGDELADVLSAVLSDGRSSRLQRRMMHQTQIAQSVAASQQSLGAQSVFQVDAVARPGVSTERLLAEVDLALAEVRAGKVTAHEVRRAVNKIETGLMKRLERLGGYRGRTELLQNYNHFLGDPGWLGRDLARYRAVTPPALAAFAREWLPPDRRVVLHAVPSGKGAR